MIVDAGRGHLLVVGGRGVVGDKGLDGGVQLECRGQLLVVCEQQRQLDQDEREERKDAKEEDIGQIRNRS